MIYFYLSPAHRWTWTGCPRDFSTYAELLAAWMETMTYYSAEVRESREDV